MLRSGQQNITTENKVKNKYKLQEILWNCINC